MKKLVLFFIVFILFKPVFSQTKNNNEPENYYSDYKNKMDSLSKISGKNVTGYLSEMVGTKKVTTIFYWENGLLKNMLLDTSRKQLPNRSSNRTVNSIRKTTH